MDKCILGEDVKVLEVGYHSLISCSSSIIMGELVLQAEHLVKHW